MEVSDEFIENPVPSQGKEFVNQSICVLPPTTFLLFFPLDRHSFLLGVASSIKVDEVSNRLCQRCANACIKVTVLSGACGKSWGREVTAQRDTKCMLSRFPDHEFVINFHIAFIIY